MRNRAVRITKGCIVESTLSLTGLLKDRLTGEK